MASALALTSSQEERSRPKVFISSTSGVSRNKGRMSLAKLRGIGDLAWDISACGQSQQPGFSNRRSAISNQHSANISIGTDSMNISRDWTQEYDAIVIGSGQGGTPLSR